MTLNLNSQNLCDKKQDWLFIYDPSLRKIVVSVSTFRLRATKLQIVLRYCDSGLCLAMTVIWKSQYKMRVRILKILVCYGLHRASSEHPLPMLWLEFI